MAGRHADRSSGSPLFRKENRVSIAVTVTCVVLLAVLLAAFMTVKGARDAEEAADAASREQASLASASAEAGGGSGASAAAQASPASSDAASSETSSTTSGSSSASASSTSASASATVSSAKRDELVDILGKEKAQKLIDRAQSSEDALWIATHPDAYAESGRDMQVKILKLAADDPEAISYVRGFPDQYPSEHESRDAKLAMSAKSPSSKVPETEIPHLYQWDLRWGYTGYNGEAFGMSGCGPTSLAMVYQGLTGDTELTPYDISLWATQNGHVVEGQGTANSLFTEAASPLGLTCEVIEPTAESIKAVLEGGRPIVANVGVGQFTDYGHFFVLTGIADNGQIIINDPYSVARSSKTWDLDLIASESIALYAYSK